MGVEPTTFRTYATDEDKDYTSTETAITAYYYYYYYYIALYYYYYKLLLYYILLLFNIIINFYDLYIFLNITIN